MRHITSCFFCCTPYQIIAAISIVRQSHETADLYMLSNDSKNYIEEIRKENIFSKVIFVENIRNESICPILKGLKSLRNYIQCDKIAEKILVPDTRYDKQYYSNNGLNARYCFFHYVKKNIPTERVVFDDGASSYMNDSIAYISRKDAIFRILLFGKKALKPISRKMLYSPDLYERTCKSKMKYDIRKINGEFNNNETKKLFNRVFHFKKSDIIKEDCILVDCMNDELLDKNELEKLRLIYKKIFQEYGVENIIVKPHPRNEDDFLEDGIKYYTNYKIPLECLYMNLNCNEKVLISVSSTALATPKLLFDQEPYIILLYRLLKLKEKDMDVDDLDRYYMNCKKLYSHPERFMIPESEEELIECLRQIKN